MCTFARTETQDIYMYDDSIILRFGDIYVAEEVLNYFFVCDLAVCKGACCTKPNTAGALLSELEHERYQTHKKQLSAILPPENQNFVQDHGPSIRRDIRYFTQSLPDTHTCVFVTKTDEVANCLIQHNQKKLGFAKPHSCSLFPIRESRAIDGRILLFLEEWDECEPAFDKGEALEVPLYVFLKEALVLRFGQAFYDEIHNFVESGQLSALFPDLETEF
jgi:hypothetical protein